MINKYIINEDITIHDYLIKRHLSNNNINMLVTNLKAVISENNVKNTLNINSLLKKGSIIYINFSLLEDNETQIGYEKAINILYEDSDIIAIDKDYNSLVHSDGVDNTTLLNQVVAYLKSKGDDSYIRPLHRIDYEASGIVVFSKNILAHADISFQMENRQIEKKYLVQVEGIVKENGTIKVLIGKNRHDSKKYLVSTTGKEAITDYKVLKCNQNATTLEVKIITGRPHQIRVSFAYLKHPIIGDKLYGNGKGNLKLISKEIAFMIGRKQITISSKKTLEHI